VLSLKQNPHTQWIELRLQEYTGAAVDGRSLQCGNCCNHRRRAHTNAAREMQCGACGTQARTRCCGLWGADSVRPGCGRSVRSGGCDRI